MKSAQMVADKWARNLGASGESIKAGVQEVQVSPTELAAQRADAYQTGVMRAVESGKWQRGLRRTTLGDWQQAMITKGLGRIASGATAAKPKMQSFLDQWLPYEDQLKQKLASTPRGDLEANIQRAMIAMRHNAAFKRQ